MTSLPYRRHEIFQAALHVGRCVVIVAFALAWGRTGWGQTAVRVDVPPFCGSQAAFQAEVADLQRADAARVTVTDVVIRLRGTDLYELTLISPDGVRVITDRACATLFRTAVVIAAAMSHEGQNALTAQSPEAASDGLGHGGSGEVASRPGARPEGLGPSSRQPPPPPRSSTERYGQGEQSAPHVIALQLGGGGGVFVGLTPKPSLGLEVLGGLSGSRWGSHVALRLLPPQSANTHGEMGLRQTVAGARVSLSHRAPAWLRLSAGLSAYWMFASGIGVAHPQSDQVAFFAPELELAAAVFQGKVLGELALNGRVGIVQPRFEVASFTTIYEVPRWGGAGVFRILWGAQ